MLKSLRATFELYDFSDFKVLRFKKRDASITLLFIFNGAIGTPLQFIMHNS